MPFELVSTLTTIGDYVNSTAGSVLPLKRNRWFAWSDIISVSNVC